MLNNFFKKNLPAPDHHAHDEAGGSASADLAAELLITPTALMQLTPQEARVVVRYMQPQMVEKGTILIREGDARHQFHAAADRRRSDD